MGRGDEEAAIDAAVEVQSQHCGKEKCYPNLATVTDAAEHSHNNRGETK